LTKEQIAEIKKQKKFELAQNRFERLKTMKSEVKLKPALAMAPVEISVPTFRIIPTKAKEERPLSEIKKQ